MISIAPWWLPGGHLQTIWPALHAGHVVCAEAAAVTYQRERWSTPDGDFIDVDWQGASGGVSGHAPLLVLFHGLEGASQSHYALAFARQARRYGLAYAAPHFRGCSGEINGAPRAYHSGDFEEIGWILQRLRQRAFQPLLVVGVSLGGNAMLRWAQEAGSQATQVASAVASIKSAASYWHKASAKPQLPGVLIPSLLLNAQNDPFVPAASLPQRDAVSRQVTLWQPRRGGHVGFAQGPWPGYTHALPEAVLQWLAQQSNLILKAPSNG